MPCRRSIDQQDPGASSLPTRLKALDSAVSLVGSELAPGSCGPILLQGTGSNRPKMIVAIQRCCNCEVPLYVHKMPLFKYSVHSLKCQMYCKDIISYFRDILDANNQSSQKPGKERIQRQQRVGVTLSYFEIAEIFGFSSDFRCSIRKL